MLDCLAVCLPGLEHLVAEEFVELGLRPSRPVHGGVAFRATERELYLANAWSRLATRVIVRLGTFEARSFAELEARAGALAWDRYLVGGAPTVFRVTATKSKLYHTGAIAERLYRVSATTPPAEGENADAGDHQLVIVRVNHDRVTVSVDSSGESLHRRGWRQEIAKAPVRETLAAAMVRASGWRADRPFVDPMCGSGTVAIEAALAAQGVAPGAHRSFAFQRWACFKPGTWASVRGDVMAAERAAPARSLPPIVAADRDAGAVRAAQANAARVGLGAIIEIQHRALSDTLGDLGRFGASGSIVTNPPYGERVGGRGDLRDLYATLGARVRAQQPEWSLGMLIADNVLGAQTRLPLTTRFHTTNGGIDVDFVVYDPIS